MNEFNILEFLKEIPPINKINPQNKLNILRVYMLQNLFD
jgi:hypothetical protein